MSERWIYEAFTCQQAIEKLIKGLYIFYNDDKVPYIHNLEVIFNKFGSKFQFIMPEDMYRHLVYLSIFYIKNRYTNYKKKIVK
jgi:HEPN domain-containing protein